MTDNEENIITEFERHLTLKNYVKESVYRYILTLKEYLSYLDMINIVFDRVNLKTALDYRSYLVNSNISRATVNNRLNRVRCFYRFLTLNSLIYKNPFKSVKGLKLGNTLIKNILSVSEMGKLLDNFSIKSDHDLMLKSIAEIMYGSGIRIGEVVVLKLENVDYDRETINIIQSKTGGKERRVITNANALKVLKDYLKYSRVKLLTKDEIETGLIYPAIKTGSFIVSLNRKLKNECDRLNLKVITAHGFRHSIATHIFKSGAGIKEVQEFLGHKKIKNTEVYTHVLKDELKSVVNRFHPRGE